MQALTLVLWTPTNERHGLPKITQPVIDTLEFARNLYPEYKRHGLGPLTKRFGVALEHHHMANYDAEATGRLLFIFIKEVAEKTRCDGLSTIKPWFNQSRFL